MKKFKIVTVCLTLILGLMACKSNKALTEAQELDMDDKTELKTPRPAGSMTKVEKIIAEVGMDEKQAEKFEAIYYDYQAKRMAVKQKAGKPHKLFEEVLALRDAQNVEVKEFLDEEQYKKYLVAIDDKKGRPKRKKLVSPSIIK